MKNLFYFIIIIIISASIIYIDETFSPHKIFQIISPTEFFIDTNKNHIFDETEPIKIENIYFIQLDKNPQEFTTLSYSEKLFLNYKANQYTQYLLKNKFVSLNNNEILINNEKYTDLLLASGFFYTSNQESKTNVLNKLKEFNLDDYVLLNTKSKKYHKLSCPEGHKSKNFKIIKKEFLETNNKPCKACIDNIASQIEENLPENIPYNESLKKENIEVFFLDLNTSFKPSKTCTTQACKKLKSEIDNAQNTIDFAIYGINNQPEIFNAIINAYNRGIKIRWVCDFDKDDQSYYKDTLELKKIIKTFNTDEIYDNENRSAIMHNKFFIIDNKKVFTGSSNITSTDFTGFNANFALLIDSANLAEVFKQEFEQMYNGKFHTHKVKNQAQTIQLNPNTKITAFFSPQDKVLTKQIIPYIQKAEKYIYIPIFFITKKELITELTNAHNKGVEIKIINDATNATSPHSIHKQLRLNGIEVKTENYAGKMHSKTIIIDDKYSIIGSMNFSNNGEKRNDENMLIIEDKEITQFLKSSFLHLWNKIPNKYLTTDPRPESIESLGSCSDGIDNDFDGKIDSKDKGCFI
ncbi:MAG: phosphatidylserine/phosphatidylglycerophosphate/cardiolipin synthase family protein [Cyanobacteria bacterium SIG29]|nr:phosphatidylserine/phosphatidylglycerophosphate/cardiolipin synthase family protein [Cyanobacteria bacterium SIG29]